MNSINKKGYENCKNAAQFPIMQSKNTSLVPNTTPFIDFGLNLLATGRVEPTIRISVVHATFELSGFNRVWTSIQIEMFVTILNRFLRDLWWQVWWWLFGLPRRPASIPRQVCGDLPSTVQNSSYPSQFFFHIGSPEKTVGEGTRSTSSGQVKRYSIHSS